VFATQKLFSINHKLALGGGLENWLGRNSSLKRAKNFLSTIQKILPENSLPLPRNRKKIKSILCRVYT